MKKIGLLFMIMVLGILSMTGCAAEPVHTMEFVEAKLQDVPFNDDILKCVCVYTKYTNGSDETVIPADYVDVNAFQNETELNIWVFTGEQMDGYNQCDMHVQAGVTTPIIWIFELNDEETTKVDIELSTGEKHTLEWAQ